MAYRGCVRCASVVQGVATTNVWSARMSQSVNYRCVPIHLYAELTIASIGCHCEQTVGPGSITTVSISNTNRRSQSAALSWARGLSTRRIQYDTDWAGLTVLVVRGGTGRFARGRVAPVTVALTRLFNINDIANTYRKVKLSLRARSNFDKAMQESVYRVNDESVPTYLVPVSLTRQRGLATGGA